MPKRPSISPPFSVLFRLTFSRKTPKKKETGGHFPIDILFLCLLPLIVVFIIEIDPSLLIPLAAVFPMHFFAFCSRRPPPPSLLLLFSSLFLPFSA